MAKKKRETLERELRKNIEEKLKARGLDEPVFRERAERYLYLSATLTDMQEDIDENGINEYDKNGNLVLRRVVAEMTRVSREIGKLYQDLGFDIEAKTKRASTGDEDL